MPGHCPTCAAGMPIGAAAAAPGAYMAAGAPGTAMNGTPGAAAAACTGTPLTGALDRASSAASSCVRAGEAGRQVQPRPGRQAGRGRERRSTEELKLVTCCDWARRPAATSVVCPDVRRVQQSLSSRRHKSRRGHAHAHPHLLLLLLVCGGRGHFRVASGRIASEAAVRYSSCCSVQLCHQGIQPQHLTTCSNAAQRG